MVRREVWLGEINRFVAGNCIFDAVCEKYVARMEVCIAGLCSSSGFDAQVWICVAVITICVARIELFVAQGNYQNIQRFFTNWLDKPDEISHAWNLVFSQISHCFKYTTLWNITLDNIYYGN